MSEMLYFSYTEQDLSRMPPRTPRSHKGTYGRAVLLCGSEGMAGAAYLCGKAAYRTGAGLVEIVTPSANLPILQTLLPEAVVTTYEAGDEGMARVREAILRADALAVGCGLGVSARSRAVLEVLATCPREIPTVYDADALNLIAAEPSLLPLLGKKVITPHPMEMSRLTGLYPTQILRETAAVAQAFAAKHGCICVLKDHESIVSDGSARVFRNQSGNSGMATGGSGDVLTGILVGLLAQEKPSVTTLETVALGVYLHGLCGDEAAKRLGEYSLMASDLIDALPQVLSKH